MPSVNSSTTISRQWELLKCIPSGPPGITAKEIQQLLENDGHKVTKRTIERDLEELSRLFPLAQNSRSIPYGWHWMEKAVFSIPGIEMSEAVSLGLLEEVMRQMMPVAFSAALERRFAGARSKLEALPGNPYSRWSDLVRYVAPGLPFSPPQIRQDILNEVQRSLLSRKKIQVEYKATGDGKHKQLILSPVGLIQQSHRTYLLAVADGRDEAYLYALHRMNSAHLLDLMAQVPHEENVEDFIQRGGAQFGGGLRIRLKLRISAHLALLLSETPMAEDQQISETASGKILTATIPESWQLRFWLLSQGEQVTVLEPEELRTSISSTLKAALVHYAGDNAPISKTS